MLRINTIELRKFPFLLILLIICFNSCSKAAKEGIKPDPDPPVKPETPISYASDYAYNLNVIYFVPKDVVPNADYEERISKILIEGQGFVSKWMKHWGFGEKTFGLLKNKENTRVKIHLIKGPENASAYANYGPIEVLFKKYFEAHPQEKTSDHYLILTATNKKLDQGESIPHEVPYYGVGRTCYAVDYPGMRQESLGKSGALGEKATVYIGGLLHELGHGINLPHNGPKTSEQADPAFGMTLMGSGNYTYGKSPTFLSYMDAAILNNGQLFSKEVKAFYAGVTAKINTIHAQVVSQEIVVDGTFTSSAIVKNVTFRNILSTDPQGYQSVTFTQISAAGNTFSVKMPISEFKTKGNLPYTLEIMLHHDNGNTSTFSYPYAFENDVPVVDFGDRDLMSKTGWQVIDFSSQQAGFEAYKLLDDQEDTYWHTSWTNPTPHPHFVTIKTGAAAITAGGLSYATRKDNPGSGGKIKDFYVEISMDGHSWTKIADFVGGLNGRQYFSFKGSKTFQYLRLTTRSDYEGKTFATIAALDLYK